MNQLQTRTQTLLKDGTMVALPTFDLHAVEAALWINSRLYGKDPLSVEQIASDVADYRQWLRAHKAAGSHPHRFHIPPMNVDRVWHTHIAETEQYARDCQEYFGCFLHHASEICNGDAEMKEELLQRHLDAK